MRITLSANAGVSVDFAGKRIWIDVLHERKVLGFSSVTPELFNRVLQHDAFKKPDLICYTHCHPDHYSKRMTLEAAGIWQDAKVLTPESTSEKWLSVTGGRWELVLDDLRITYIRLPHEGTAYANAIHYGIILSDGYRNILIPGDCKIGSQELAEAVKGLTIDLAILDFPWIALPKGRAFLEAHVRPMNICVYHLPFAEDDMNGYRLAATNAAARMGDRVCVLMDALQSVDYV